jgi:hypothetical protein
LLRPGDEKMIGIWRRPRWAHGFLVVVAAWAITAVLGLVIVGKVTGSGPTPTGSAQHTGSLPGLGWNPNRYPLGPPGLAEKTTAAGARAAVGFPVLVPSDAAASPVNLTQVWVNKHNGEVALVFDKGKADITMARATKQNDLRYFQAFVTQKNKNRVTDAIGQVNGQPALVITPDTSAICHCNPAVVEFNRNGIHVSIYSNTYGTGTLLAIANSMR